MNWLAMLGIIVMAVGACWLSRRIDRWHKERIAAMHRDYAAWLAAFNAAEAKDDEDEMLWLAETDWRGFVKRPYKRLAARHRQQPRG